jgi:FemAB-related protein (PEP-CTERM system-associated)
MAFAFQARERASVAPPQRFRRHALNPMSKVPSILNAGDSTRVLAVREWDAADAAAWDSYVLAHPRATFFHQTGWKRVLEETFGYEPRYLLAEEDGRVRGVLPLFLCRSLRGRMGLYSLPHTVYGGPVGADAAAEEALLAKAREIAADAGAATVEFRNRHANLLDLPRLEGFVTFEKDLPGTAAEVYKTFPKKAREAINQATKRWQLEADFRAPLDEFYGLLAASYLRLGTPVFPRRFFAAIQRHFPDTSILVVRHEGRPVASVLSVVFRSTMMPLYSGENDDATRLKANNFKYFRLMEHAVERGLTRFDFGRSRLSNEGTVGFKTNQGFEATPLPYQAQGASASADPNTGIFPKVRKLWTRLPAPVARTLGPRLIRYFP